MYKMLRDVPLYYDAIGLKAPTVEASLAYSLDS